MKTSKISQCYLRFGYFTSAVLLATLLFPVLHSAAVELPRPTPHELAAIITAGGERLWYHEEEFRRNPALRAAPEHVVILHLAPAAKHQRFIDHAIPYIFPETATYTFCIPKKEPFLQDLELIREGSATRAVQLKRGNKCQTREIAAGLYRLQVRHDGKDIGPDGEKAFIHVPRFKGGARVGSELGGPQVGDTLSSFPSPCDSNSDNNPLFTFTTPDGMFVNPIFTANNKIQTTATAEVSFGWNICPDSSGNVTLGNRLYGGYFSSSGPPNTDTTLYATKTPTPFSLTDRGNGQFTLAANFGGSLYPIVLGPDHALHWAAPGTPPTVFTVHLKYYDTFSTAPSLQAGNVALYRGCNYDTSAGTWVFITPIVNFASYTIFFSSADNMFGSVKVGPQTQAVLFAGANSSGQAQIVAGDIPCLSNTPLGGGTASSLIVTPYRNFLVATDTCLNCDLSGLDLSGLNLAGGRFQGSTFTGANLANAVLQSASLDNTNLTGANTILTNTNLLGAVVRCTNFSGADLSSATFQVSNLITPIVTTDFSCRMDLTGATINLNSFLFSQWRYFNLTGATINGITGATLSTTDSQLDLSGAILNQTKLPQVILDGANLGCAVNGSICTQLYKASLTSASLKHVSLEHANLSNAYLSNTNLDGASLCGANLNAQNPAYDVSANLQGAFMRNVNLYQADLTNVDLSYASFYSTGLPGSCSAACGFTPSCASAGNATMDNADFTSAYLAGADFSGSQSTLEAANFSNAILMGSNFSGANLGEDNGKSTNFTGAWLQGVDFTDATVTGANFADALVDIDPDSVGVRAQVQLCSKSVAFAGGYTPSAGSILGCVEFSTDGPTETPGTDNSNECPDHSIGPCLNSTQWLPQLPSTSCPMVTTACTHTTRDTNWSK